MTISSNLSTVTRNGNGITTEFPFPFKVWEASQLEVYILDVDGKATLTTNWTATLSDLGGSITYPAVGGAVLPTGQRITILRNMPFTQTDDYVNATPFLAENIESAMDKLTATCQQIKEAMDRSVKIDPGSTDPGAYMTEIRSAVASTAQDASSADTARIAAEAAQEAAEAASANVTVRSTEPIIATGGQTVFDLGFVFSDAARNVAVFINGIKQATDSYTLASPNVTLDIPCTAGDVFQAFSIDITAVPSAPLYANQSLADLPDKAVARANLGLGDSATKSVGTTAGTVCAGDDLRLGANTDSSARNIAMRNALKLGILAGDASGAIPGGWLHLFATDELATKTNATYDAANKCYTNRPSGTVTDAYAVASASGAARTIIDLGMGIIPNGRTIKSIGAQFGASSTGKVKIFQLISSGVYLCVYEQSLTASGAGWVDVTLSTPFTVPATGSYYIGVYVTGGLAYNATTSDVYIDGDITPGSGNTSITAAHQLINMRYTYTLAALNMTLTPVAIAAGSAPKSIDVYVLHHAIDAVTLNTDLKVRVTLDGTNWSAYGMLEDLGQYNADYKLLHTKIDTSMLTGTTGIKWEITTYNVKAQQVRATAMLLGF